jgi:hypothetical protein
MKPLNCGVTLVALARGALRRGFLPLGDGHDQLERLLAALAEELVAGRPDSSSSVSASNSAALDDLRWLSFGKTPSGGQSD